MIPIRDSQRTYTTPWVNYAFIILNVAVFLYSLGLSTTLPSTRRQVNAEFQAQTQGVCYGFEALPTDADRFYCRWGYQPREFFDNVNGRAAPGTQSRMMVLLTVVTSAFLHGGWLHIIGNMLFLWVFGDNVEDRLGHALYALFYLAGGIVAALIQGAIDPDSVIPVVGASGAVAAVLGSYIVWYPRATVTVGVPIVLILLPVPLPAIVMIGVWFLQNLIAGVQSFGQTADPGGGVAWFAHVGGFLFGAVVAVFASAVGLGASGRRK